MSELNKIPGVSVEDGKYTIQMDADGNLRCLRYGQEWRDLTGDKMALAFAQEVQNLREKYEQSKGFWENSLRDALRDKDTQINTLTFERDLFKNIIRQSYLYILGKLNKKEQFELGKDLAEHGTKNS